MRPAELALRALLPFLITVQPALADPPEGRRAPELVVGQPLAFEGLGFEAHLRAAGRLVNFGETTVDRYGTVFDHDVAIDTQFRVGLVYDSAARLRPVNIRLEYEHDLFAGVVYGGAFNPGVGQFMPGAGGYKDHVLRKAFLRAAIGPYLSIGGGFTTSHWGLGLVANDGDHGWTPGSARFDDPRGGDRVLRAFLATGPHTREGLVIFAAFDRVEGDDVLLPGDEAIQAVGGLRVGTGKPYEAGLYGVWRRQRARGGDVTEVGVVDVYARGRVNLPKRHRLDIAFEGAVIFGTTELAPSTRYPEHDVLQLGAALRIGYDAGLGGALLDILYASGDRNFDDRSQNAFRADINFPMGLVLFQHLIAAQTGRTPMTASDPGLVGVPNNDLDRIPTRGNVTNTVAIFPRGWIRPVDGLEIYAGVLIALSEVDYTDPFNSRLAGGDPRNPTNGDPGMYYGTELDVGIRYQALIHGTLLTVGLEGGALFPGSALNDATGATPGALLGGRFMLAYGF